MVKKKLIFRSHAIKRMFERKISDGDVRHVLNSGKVIENNPASEPYPSALKLGWVGKRPVHVVYAEIVKGEDLIIITVYEPDEINWEPGFEKRRKK